MSRIYATLCILQMLPSPRTSRPAICSPVRLDFFRIAHTRSSVPCHNSLALLPRFKTNRKYAFLRWFQDFRVLSPSPRCSSLHATSFGQGLFPLEGTFGRSAVSCFGAQAIDVIHSLRQHEPMPRSFGLFLLGLPLSQMPHPPRTEIVFIPPRLL